MDAWQAEPANLLYRDACIQRFEYTWELAHKMLRRYLAETEPSSDAVAAMSFSELIRRGADVGLLHSSWDVWRLYRHARNLTSHTYDANHAEEVADHIPGFLAEARARLHELNRRPA